MRKIVLVAVAALVPILVSQATLAEESCSGSGTPMPKSAIAAQLKAQGYTQIRDIRSHGGCYEAKGFDKNGKRFELEINSYTGKISHRE